MLVSYLQSEREKSAKEMVAVTDASSVSASPGNQTSSVSASPGNQTPTGSKRKSTGSYEVFDL